ncbi:MAG TPA: fimbria/pilus outer membrane usher protein [Nevskiaceae bacterium]|nr:fimbria/pilus outer membrane usher protein [Nevskiaceae bacterium]
MPLLALLTLPAHAAGNAAPEWFGAPCSSSEELPAAAGEMLLSVRRQPDDPGSDELVLRTVDGRMWVQRETLRSWNLPPPPVMQDFRGAPWYALAAIDGVRYRYDSCLQVLWLDAATAQPLVRYAVEVPPGPPPDTAAPGGFFNIEPQYTHASGAPAWSGLAHAGLFNGWGYGGSSLLEDGSHPVRLDTNWVVDDLDHLQRLSLGDGISRSSTFGRSLHFGGVQWGREFSLRPDLVTFPQPALRGDASLPSSVDVYVNQMLRSHQDVPAGPFELDRIPVVTGSGDVLLVVRDLLGREQVISSSFYASPQLLTAGLTDYTFEAGFPRNSYGVRSNDYGALFGAGTWRRGYADWLTGEFRGELARDRQLLGASAAMLVPRVGTANIGVAASSGDAGLGGSAVFGIERVSPRWSVGAEARQSTAHFRQLGGDFMAIRNSQIVHVGVVPHISGSLSLAWVHQQYFDGDDTRIASLNYMLKVGRDVYANLSVTDARSASDDRSYLLSLTSSFGGNVSGSVQHEFQPGREPRNRLDVQRSPSGPLGLTLQAAADDGGDYRRQFDARWADQRGTTTADYAQDGGQREERIGYSTGFALLDDSFYWTRPVEGSFALVEVPSTPDVAVYANEHYAGRTDGNGKLLVPDLRAYEANTLRLDDADLPMDREVTSLRSRVVPPPLSGVTYRFPLRINRELLLHLKRLDGSAVPAGASIAGQDLPVGFGGVASVGGISTAQALQVQWDSGSCRAWIAPPAVADAQPIDVVCR